MNAVRSARARAWVKSHEYYEKLKAAFERRETEARAGGGRARERERGRERERERGGERGGERGEDRARPRADRDRDREYGAGAGHKRSRCAGRRGAVCGGRRRRSCVLLSVAAAAQLCQC